MAVRDFRHREHLRALPTPFRRRFADDLLWCSKSACGWHGKFTTRWRRVSSAFLLNSTLLAVKLNGDIGVARQQLDLARKMARHSLTEARRSVMDLRTSALEEQDLLDGFECSCQTVDHASEPRESPGGGFPATVETARGYGAESAAHRTGGRSPTRSNTPAQK